MRWLSLLALAALLVVLAPRSLAGG